MIHSNFLFSAHRAENDNIEEEDDREDIKDWQYDNREDGIDCEENFMGSTWTPTGRTEMMMRRTTTIMTGRTTTGRYIMTTA